VQERGAADGPQAVPGDQHLLAEPMRSTGGSGVAWIAPFVTMTHFSLQLISSPFMYAYEKAKLGQKLQYL
jgi:hypothetical protein